MKCIIYINRRLMRTSIIKEGKRSLYNIEIKNWNLQKCVFNSEYNSKGLTKNYKVEHLMYLLENNNGLIWTTSEHIKTSVDIKTYPTLKNSALDKVYPFFSNNNISKLKIPDKNELVNIPINNTYTKKSYIIYSIVHPDCIYPLNDTKDKFNIIYENGNNDIDNLEKNMSLEIDRWTRKAALGLFYNDSFFVLYQGKNMKEKSLLSFNSSNFRDNDSILSKNISHNINDKFIELINNPLAEQNFNEILKNYDKESSYGGIEEEMKEDI